MKIKIFEFKMDSRIRVTILEMLNQRKYTEIKEEENRIMAIDNQGKIVCVFMEILVKLNVAEIKRKIVIMEEEKIPHTIIIHNQLDIPTSNVKGIIEQLPNLNMEIEAFPDSDLLINITKHVYVPKHEVLSVEEGRNFRAKYGTDIQVLLKTDPISRFYNYRKGDIIEITRKNGCIAYRIVK